MTAAAIITGGAGILLTVMGVWAYTGHWSTWFTRSRARGRVEYTGPAALLTGVALLFAAAVMATVLAGAPRTVSYALIAPVVVSAALSIACSIRAPKFLIPSWTRAAAQPMQAPKQGEPVQPPAAPRSLPSHFQGHPPRPNTCLQPSRNGVAGRVTS